MLPGVLGLATAGLAAKPVIDVRNAFEPETMCLSAAQVEVKYGVFSPICEKCKYNLCECRPCSMVYAARAMVRSMISSYSKLRYMPPTV
jgi:hypothetical protein